MRNVAEVKSGNTHKGMIEFEKKAKELETLDVKIVAFLWSILIFNDRQKLAKEIRKNNDNMLAITKKVMKDRNIPLEDPGLSALLATITKQERKEYLTLCK